MIEAVAVYLRGHFKSLIIKGHGSLGYGKDIYCAGVSSCLVGALNNLEGSESFSIDIRSGDSKVERIKDMSDHDEIVLETLITQLVTIANSYPDEVKVTVSGKEGQL